MDIQPQERSQPQARTSKQRLWLREISKLKRKQKNKQKKQPASFLSLPLELRIMVYNHAISDQEHNISKRRHGYRLPGLFHIHPLITHEIYQFCHITTIINTAVPLLRSTTAIYNPMTTLNTVVTVYKLHMASKAVRVFRKSRGGKGPLSMKVKIRCVGCKKGKCKGLDWEDPCWECVVFEKHWNRSEVGTEDMWAKDLFEFC